MKQIAELMVREGLQFREAVLELHLALTPQECDAVKNRAEFQNILRDEKLQYQTGIGDNPLRSKAAALGLMHIAIEKLMEAGEYDKAISGIEKLSKLEGWIGNESTINVFAGLSARDIEAAKERLNGTGRATKPSLAN